MATTGRDEVRTFSSGLQQQQPIRDGERDPLKLYVSRVPLSLGEEGLQKHLLRLGGPLPTDVWLKPGKPSDSGEPPIKGFAFIEFASTADASVALQVIDDALPYRLQANYAIKSERDVRERIIEKEFKSFREQRNLRQSMLHSSPILVNGGSAKIAHPDVSCIMAPAPSRNGLPKLITMTAQQTMEVMNKLLMVLPNETVKCEVCDSSHLEHLHFLVDEARIVDPNGAMPQIVALFCKGCNSTTNLKLCSGCNQVSYCGRQCQQKDWSRHAVHCNRSMITSMIGTSTGSSRSDSPTFIKSANGTMSSFSEVDGSYNGGLIPICSPEESVKSKPQLPSNGISKVSQTVNVPVEAPMVASKPQQPMRPGPVQVQPLQPKKVEPVPIQQAKPVVAELVKPVAPVVQQQKLFPKCPETTKLTEGREYPGVVVVFGTSPCDFYIHKDDEDAREAEDLTAAITKLVQAKGKGGTGDPAVVVNSLYGAKYSEDNSWYRAEVLQIVGDKCLVQFVDWGNSDTVPIDEMVCLPQAIAIIPKLAVKCAVEGIRPKEGNAGFSTEASDVFNNLAITHSTAIAKGYNADGFICLIDLLDPIRASLADTLLEKKLVDKLVRLPPDQATVVASPATLKVQLPTTPAIRNTEPMKASDSSPPAPLREEKVVSPSPSKLKKFIQERQSPPQANVSIKSVLNEMAVRDKFLGLVTRALTIGDGKLECLLLIDSSSFTALTEDLSAFCNKHHDSMSKSTITAGMFVAAKSRNEGDWYRGFVYKVTPNGSFVVVFVDSGYTEICDVCTPLSDRFEREPILGAYAVATSRFDGTLETDEPSEFAGILASPFDKSAKIRALVGGGKIEMELFPLTWSVIATNPAIAVVDAALDEVDCPVADDAKLKEAEQRKKAEEAAEVARQTLLKEAEKKRLAQEQVRKVEEEKQEETKRQLEETRSRLEAEKRQRELAEKDAALMKAKEAETAERATYEKKILAERAAKVDAAAKAAAAKSSYPKFTFTTDNEVTCPVVWEEGGFFFLSGDSNASNKIMELLAKPTSALPAAAKKGDIVVAQSPSDELFYRASVNDVTGTTANVFFIDYGNSEGVPTSKIFDLPDEIGVDVVPALAVKCKVAANDKAERAAKKVTTTYEKFGDLTVLPTIAADGYYVVEIV